MFLQGDVVFLHDRLSTLWRPILMIPLVIVMQPGMVCHLDGRSLLRRGI